MTKCEFFSTIKDIVDNEEIKMFAANELTKMETMAEKRRNTLTKKQIEDIPLIERIRDELLSDEPITATIAGNALGVSPQKATSLLKRAVKEGIAEVSDIKVSKKGTQKGYTKV